MRIVFQHRWCARKAKREASLLNSAPNMSCTAPKVNDHLRRAIGPGLLAAMALVPVPDLTLPLPCSGSSAWSLFFQKSRFPLMGLRASAQQYRSFHSDCPHVLARTTTYVSEFLLKHQFCVQIPSVRPSPSPGPTRRELNASNFLCFCSQS